MAVSPPAVQSLEQTGRGLLEQAQARVRPRLRHQVEARLVQNRQEVGYHLGLLDEQGRPSAAGAGKAVRPALCFAAAQTVGSAAEVAGAAAVAVQLVHDFSLAHDDIIDGDQTRRHRPAVWAAFGTSAGVLAGDALLGLAFTTLADADYDPAALAQLAETVVELVEGEAEDVAFEQRQTVRPSEYTAMATAKTGALMGCACALGALAGGGEESRVRLLRAFGRHLGVAFQVSDDLLGIYGQEQVTGKPVGSDIATRKKTLPVLAALASETPAGRELADLYSWTGELTPTAVERAAELVAQAGGVRAARQAVDQELKLAHAALAEADPAPVGHRELLALAHLLTHREH
ncbi:polyprenyl synthetase family protein [Lipingzhangella sp. LS1_29]|uniref:Polyprenyl synthetase family protein n=1 Tax=Lipingzhangella rawalii TaxID=2055835 RepID=A0ABU2HBG6_9ACTN|nr:polyprenyl synthetase family protein [Lipingzhangella rawalii]MDS1272663.1 polyprenyl synthetase family protein [Lipingzhangella rawalii]